MNEHWIEPGFKFLDLGNEICRAIDDILDKPQVVTLCGMELTVRVEKNTTYLDR
jgi:hypothetical protein